MKTGNGHLITLLNSQLGEKYPWALLRPIYVAFHSLV
jgi:hypothetical protein